MVPRHLQTLSPQAHQERGWEMSFLTRCDVPNWAFILMFGLCWMLRVCGEHLEHLRMKRYYDEEKP